MSREQVRNFTIIAHIDHGKSTLADRLIELSGGLSTREMRAQVLDSMDIERERGITIKAQAVCLWYTGEDGQRYKLNLIDTPGHVDFSYEVSRSLAACEGSLLVVDASQGVEAQTLANAYMAVDADHVLIPVLNKIDLPAARPEEVKRQIEDLIGIEATGALEISAKSGLGIEGIFQAIIEQLPAPGGDVKSPLQAMIIDSWYDSYLGVVVLIRVREGVIRRGMKIRFLATDAVHVVERLGVRTPKLQDVPELQAGDVGVLMAGAKNISDCKVGDTITTERQGAVAVAGFKPTTPVVFCGLFPVDASDFSDLEDALGKLALNDASFTCMKETSAALGLGFRCGFLGLLHLEIISERLEREFALELIATAPSVIYKLVRNNGEELWLHNPSDMPDAGGIATIYEPWIKASILVPDAYLGAVLTLCNDRRGEQIDLMYVGSRAMLRYALPLNEVVFDFYDRLKSISRGHASFDYEVDGHRAGDLVKVAFLINGDPVDALSLMVHRSQAESRGRAVCVKLKESIPRQLFKIAIQAAIGGKIIARETIGALRKDVTAKCYGGDVTRKRKLLEKQKKGKKKMRQLGKIHVPQSAFLDVLKIRD